MVRLPDFKIAKALTRLGPELVSLEVFLRVIDEGSNPMRDNYMRRVTQRRWKQDERKQIAGRLVKLLDEDDPETLAVAGKAMAFLKLGGGAERLAELLGHGSAAVRAASAYAVAVVPDRGSVADRAKRALPSLLAEEDHDVRQAAMVLANDLIEGWHGYSPHLSAEKRAEAIERIKAKLGS